MTNHEPGKPLSDAQLDEIVNRIAKLNNTTGRTPEEAAAFVSKVQELLTKYNLTMAAVQSRTRANGDPLSHYTKTIIDLGAKATWIAQWRRVLLNVVARENWCRMLYVPHTAKAELIGEPHNIQAVVDLYKWLVAQLMPMCNVAWKQSYHGYTQSEERKWRTSFFMGAATIIQKRLHEARLYMEQQFVNSTALVVYKDKELAQAVNKFAPYIRAARGNGGKIDYSGYSAGEAAGSRVQIRKEVQR